VIARRLASVALVLAATLAVDACGERKEPTTTPARQSLTLMLDFFPNADHAGIYAAQGQGDFARAGLDVRIRTPSDPAAPLKLLQAGKVDLAVSYEPELLLARDHGARLVAVAALVQKPLTSIMSVGKGAIGDPRRLEGRTVGTAGIPYQSAYLEAILSRAGVAPGRVREVNVGFNLVPAMLTHRVDATLGAFWNYEGIQLAQQRKHPQIIRVDRAGVPTYAELIIVAREDDVRKRGARIRRFLRALAQGHEALRRDPQTGVRPLLRANHDLDARLQLASVKATLPIFFPSDPNRPFGFMDPREWIAYGEWMERNHLLHSPPAAGRALTDEFLPGQGV
jgi:putative hydroxymethylpyrimidine transport system substrate-binding protein